MVPTYINVNEGCHYAQNASTFALWPHSAEQLEDFDTHLNEQHPHIQFTREEKTNNQISFLDVLVKKMEPSGLRCTGTCTLTLPHTTRESSQGQSGAQQEEQRKYVMIPRRKRKCYISTKLSREMGTQNK